MRLKHIIQLVALSCLLALIACQSNKPAKSATSADQDIFSGQYYITNAKNNLERLKLLLTGLYVQHNENTKEKKYYTWTVGGGTDSILLYSLPVGTPTKDGHWLYMHQFMSNLPDEPVYSALQFFKQSSRDTIESTFFVCPKSIKLEDLITKGADLFKDVDYSKLEPNGEQVTYVKDGSVSFNGYSQIYENPRKDQQDYRMDEYFVGPKRFKFQSQFYKDAAGTDFKEKNSIISHLVRLDPAKNAMFAKKK